MSNKVERLYTFFYLLKTYRSGIYHIYYYGECGAQKNDTADQINRLLHDIKLTPSECETNPKHKKDKESAPREIGRLLTKKTDPAFVSHVSFVPIPISKNTNDPDHCDILLSILEHIHPKENKHVANLLRQANTANTSHLGQNLTGLTTEEISETLEVDTSLIDKLRPVIVLFNDTAAMPDTYFHAAIKAIQRHTNKSYIGLYFAKMPLPRHKTMPLSQIPIEAHFSPDGSPTAAIVRELDQAKESVLVQAYILTSDKIITAIINAHNRPGVQVQILLNGRQKRSQRLQQSKVPIRLDKKHTEAHNKVMIIDGHTVITGSFNFTEEAERENAENLLVIKDTLLAKQYAENWHHHWEHFDDEKLNVTPLKRNLVLRPRLARFEEYFKAHVRPKLIQYFEEHPQLIENFQPGIEAHFSPGDSPTAAIVHELDQARESVLVQAFILTSDEIIEAIINAHNRPGVQVEILLDVKKAREQNSKQNLKLCRLCESKSGSKLRPWVDNEHESGAAHNKVIIIDNCIVITGSFNFTITAETQNAENLLIIRDPALAKQYTENYYFHLAHSPYLWFPEWTPPHQGW